MSPEETMESEKVESLPVSKFEDQKEPEQITTPVVNKPAPAIRTFVRIPYNIKRQQEKKIQKNRAKNKRAKKARKLARLK